MCNKVKVLLLQSKDQNLQTAERRYLKIRNREKEFWARPFLAFLEDFPDHSGNDADSRLVLLHRRVGAAHGESLSRACLAVRQHSGVVTCELNTMRHIHVRKVVKWFTPSVITRTLINQGSLLYLERYFLVFTSTYNRSGATWAAGRRHMGADFHQQFQKTPPRTRNSIIIGWLRGHPRNLHPQLFLHGSGYQPLT